jgi:hypothetical protein
MKKILSLLTVLVMGLVSAGPAISWTHGNAGGPPPTCVTLPSVSCDSNGWTVLTPVAGYCAGQSGSSPACNPAAGVTRIIYVSNTASGNTDSAACGTIAVPCTSPSYGAAILRDGSPDWLLMKCGDVWVHDAPGLINKSGLNASNPMIFSSYDPGATQTPPLPDPYSCSARPQFNMTPSDPFALGSFTGSYLAYVGLSLYAYTRDPANGSFSATDSQAVISGLGNIAATANSILVEDYHESFVTDAMSFTGENYPPLATNLYVRRNEILSAYAESQNEPATSGILMGPVAGDLNFYENVIDHNGWNFGSPNSHTVITWAPTYGFKHNIYFSGGGNNGNLVTGTTPTFVGNVLGNEPSAPAFRYAMFGTQNLCILDPFCATSNSTVPGVTNTFNNNVALQSQFSSGDSTMGLQIVSRYINENLAQSPTNIFNNILSGGVGDPNGDGFQFGTGSSNNTLLGNIIYNWSFGTPANAISDASACLVTSPSPTECPIYSSTGFANITNGGTNYVDRSVTITSAAASTDGQNYIVATVSPNTTGIANLSTVMYKVGSGPLLGPYQVDVTDSTHIIIYQTTFTGSFTGTLYYGWYNVPLSCISCAAGGSATGAQADLISAGGVIVAAWLLGTDNQWCCEVQNSGGTGYSVGDTLNAPPGTALSSQGNLVTTGGFSWNGSANTGSGMVITIPSGGLAINTIAPTGCNLTLDNAVDAAGANTCSYTDPNRSAGSYYATGGSGAWTPTANATFTGVVSSGVLTVSGWSGNPLHVGDAVTWTTPTQTKQDYIKYTSGGTIASIGNLTAVACSTFPSGCSSNVFSGVALVCDPCTSGGNGATANITVDNSKVSGIQLTNGGASYTTSDILTVASTDIGGAGGGNSNFTIPVSGVGGGNTISTFGTPTVATCSASPAGCTTNNTHTYNGVPLCGGIVCLSNNATANVTVTAGTVSAVTLVSGGSNYVLNDLLSTPTYDRNVGVTIGGLLNAPVNGGLTTGLTNFTVQALTFTAGGSGCGGTCTGSGGNGTYGLTGINQTICSPATCAMSSYSGQQLINLQRNQSKATWGSNNPLSACNVNNYIRQGFGVAAMTCPAGG